MVATALAPPVLHLHLSGRCNLACRHCYTMSGPDRSQPVLGPWRAWIEAGRRLGFPVVSLSGGEPLMSPDLMDLAALARAAGMQVNLVTNGTLVSPRNAASLARAFDRIAVSFDGGEAAHNHLRASPTAFARARRGLEQLVDAGARVGLIMAVTPASMTDIRAVIELAADVGAAFVQLHPLEAVGRAEAALAGADIQRLAILGALYRAEFAGRGVAVHVDIAPAFAEPVRAGRSAAETLGVLVVTETGAVAPLAYGVDAAWLTEDLAPEAAPEAIEAWLTAGGREDLERVRRTAAETARTQRWPFVNWYEVLRSASARASPRNPFATGRPVPTPA